MTINQHIYFLSPITCHLPPATLSNTEFIAFQRETQRKCLTGDLEIKLRQIYFDRIERSGVANMIDSIYKQVTLLEDMQFLIKYATTVLPPSPSDDAGDVVWENILTLQNELTGDNLPTIGLQYVIMYPICPHISLTINQGESK